MEPDDPVAGQVSGYMEQQSSQLDEATQRRLDAARQQAVALAEQREQRRSDWFGRPWWVKAGYAAAFCLAVAAGLLVLNAQTAQKADEATALELVLLNDDFEIMEEELAFYDWMESELGGRG